MAEVTGTPSRKDDHIRINLEEDVQFHGLTTGLDRYRFPHTALPELNLADVSIVTRLFNKPLTALRSDLKRASATLSTEEMAVLVETGRLTEEAAEKIARSAVGRSVDP